MRRRAPGGGAPGGEGDEKGLRADAGQGSGWAAGGQVVRVAVRRAPGCAARLGGGGLPARLRRGRRRRGRLRGQQHLGAGGGVVGEGAVEVGQVQRRLVGPPRPARRAEAAALAGEGHQGGGAAPGAAHLHEAPPQVPAREVAPDLLAHPPGKLQRLGHLRPALPHRAVQQPCFGLSPPVLSPCLRHANQEAIGRACQGPGRPSPGAPAGGSARWSCTPSCGGGWSSCSSRRPAGRSSPRTADSRGRPGRRRRCRRCTQTGSVKSVDVASGRGGPRETGSGLLPHGTRRKT